MDIRSLKLELLERIALIDNEARLLALKRVLDAPRGYDTPDGRLSVVKEEEASYLRLEDRQYSAEEVRALVEEALRSAEDPANMDPEELAALEASRERFLKGEGAWYTMDELEARLKVRSDK